MRIEEDYVSFELAKLLNEKGFDEFCNKMYTANGALISNSCEDCILAPTHQMAMKWLREVHKLGVFPTLMYVYLDGHESYPWGCLLLDLNTNDVLCDDPLETFPADSYESATESGIRYCLEKLIHE